MLNSSSERSSCLPAIHGVLETLSKISGITRYMVSVFPPNRLILLSSLFMLLPAAIQVILSRSELSEWLHLLRILVCWSTSINLESFNEINSSVTDNRPSLVSFAALEERAQSWLEKFSPSWHISSVLVIDYWASSQPFVKLFFLSTYSDVPWFDCRESGSLIIFRAQAQTFWLPLSGSQ